MIVTKNSFAAYQLLPGTLAQQIALLAVDLYVLFDRNILFDDFMNWWLGGHEAFIAIDTFRGLQWTIAIIHFLMCCLTVSTEYMKIKAMNEVSMAAGLILNLLWTIIMARLWW
jgi:hypothetical protein